MKKKNLKGMTLVEIIVALAIFGMLGVVLVQLGSNVDKTTRSSNRLNKRVAIQAPYAASQNTEYSYEVEDDDGNVSVVDASLTPNFTNIEVYIDNDDNNIADVVSVKKSGVVDRVDVDSDTKIYGNRYSTQAIVDQNKEVYDPDEVSNSGHHLQFISIVERIEIEKDMEVGDTYQITYTDDDGNEQPITGAVWTSSENAADIATISANGLITAVAEGDCIYIGTADGGRRYVVTITVEPVI